MQGEVDRAVVREAGQGEAALVAESSRQATLVQDSLERVVHLDGPAQRLGKRWRAHGCEHELLEVGRTLRVPAAVEDVQKRQREQRRVIVGEVAVERLSRLGRGCVRDGERDAEDRVRAELRLVRCAVQVDHHLVDLALGVAGHADDLRRDRVPDVGDRLQDSLTAVARRVAVAQLDGFERAGGGARGHGRRAARSAFEGNFDGDGGVGARVQDLPRVD